MPTLAQELNGMNGTRPKTLAGFDPSPVPALADPTLHVSSQITPGELSNAPLPNDTSPTGDGKTLTKEQALALIADAENQFIQARGRKGKKAGLFLESRAVWQGDHYHAWDASRTGGWVDIRPEGWEANGRRFETRPLIVGKVLENIARVTRNDPDVGVSPATTDPQNVQGAHEGRAVTAHFDQDWNSEAQIRSVVQESDVAGPPCWKEYFDPSQYDDLPTGANGEMESVQCGKIIREIVPWEQWFGPSGNFYHSWNEVRVPWLIHARPMKLSDLQSYYKNAWAVAPEPTINGDINIMAMLSGYGYLQDWSAADSKEWVLLKERYENPTPALKKMGYPDGRITTWANGVLLDVRNMDDGFPFFPVYNVKIENDIDGMNYVGRLLSSQRSINRLFSKKCEYADMPPANVLADARLSFDVGDYKGPDMKVITYNNGSNPSIPPPVWQPKPPLPGDVDALLNLELQTFHMLSGITPGADIAAPDASGAAFEKRMESDISICKDQIANLQASLLWCYNRAIVLTAKYYTTERLVFMSDDQGGEASRSVMSFKALNAGAKVHLKLSPDSAVPRLPGQQLEFLHSVIGMVAPDGSNLPIIIAFLQQSDMYGTDDLAEELAKTYQQMMQDQQAKQPNPEQIQQMKAEQAAATQKAEHDHEQSMAAVKEMIDDNAAHNQEAHDMRMAAIQDHSSQIDHALDLHKQEVMAALNSKLDLLLKQWPTLSGTMDPTGVLDLEDKLGIEGKVPPVPTAAPAGKPKTTARAKV